MDRKEILLRMYHAHRLFMRELVSAQLMVSDLSELQTRELFTLETLAQNAWLSMSELATKLKTAKNTMTGVVNRMVRRGLVERRHSEKDRRVVEVALTAKGKKTFKQFLQLHLDFGEGLFDEWSEKEAIEYVTLVEKVVNKLREESSEG